MSWLVFYIRFSWLLSLETKGGTPTLPAAEARSPSLASLRSAHDQVVKSLLSLVVGRDLAVRLGESSLLPS